MDSRIVEPGELALFAVLCRAYRPRVLWDVGANMGLYSWLFLSESADNTAILFEPDPDNLALIDRTIEDNGLGRALVKRCAVSDRVGDAVFAVDSRTGHTGHLTTMSIDANNVIQVPLVTLDQMVEEFPPPDILKIDVEGAEGSVMAGGANILKKHQPIVLFECFGGSDAARDMLGDTGYALFNAEDPDASTSDAVNFLALPRDKAGDMDAHRVDWRAEMTERGL
jgi:FkbM family methyltransferase